jgi:hypothetical protein
MKISLRLYATLSDYLPPGAERNTVELTIPDGASPHQVLDELHVPRALTHLVVVNGIYLDPADRDKPVLHDGDRFAVWPPVAGG